MSASLVALLCFLMHALLCCHLSHDETIHLLKGGTNVLCRLCGRIVGFSVVWVVHRFVKLLGRSWAPLMPWIVWSGVLVPVIVIIDLSTITIIVSFSVLLSFRLGVVNCVVVMVVIYTVSVCSFIESIVVVVVRRSFAGSVIFMNIVVVGRWRSFVVSVDFMNIVVSVTEGFVVVVIDRAS